MNSPHSSTRKKGILLYSTLVIAALILIYLSAILSTSFFNTLENKRSALIAKATFAARSATENANTILDTMMEEARATDYKEYEKEYYAIKFNNNPQKIQELLKKYRDHYRKVTLDWTTFRKNDIKKTDSNTKDLNVGNDNIYQYGYVIKTKFPYTDGYIIAGGRIKDVTGNYITRYSVSRHILQYKSPMAAKITTDSKGTASSKGSKTDKKLVSTLKSIWSLSKTKQFSTWIGVGQPWWETYDYTISASDVFIGETKAADCICRLAKIYSPQSGSGAIIYEKAQTHNLYNKKTFTDILKNFIRNSKEWNIYTTLENNENNKIDEHLKLKDNNTDNNTDNNKTMSIEEFNKSLSSDNNKDRVVKGKNIIITPLFKEACILHIDEKILEKFYKDNSSSSELNNSTVGSDIKAFSSSFWEDRTYLKFGTKSNPNLIMQGTVENPAILIVTGDLKIRGSISGNGILIVFGNLSFVPIPNQNVNDRILIYAAGNIICSSPTVENTLQTLSPYINMPQELIPRLATFASEYCKNKNKDYPPSTKDDLKEVLALYRNRYWCEKIDLLYWDLSMEKWYNSSSLKR